MNQIESLLAHPLAASYAWALIHFVWQGALAALLLAGGLHLLRERSTGARYGAACATLLLMALLPVLTMAIIYRPASPDSAASASPFVAGPVRPSPAGESGALTANPAPVSPEFLSVVGSERLTPLLPWLMAGWLAGVVFFSLRLAGGWFYTQRLKRRVSRPLEEKWQRALGRLCRELRVARRVQLLESALVRVPTAIGWLRPVILIPVGVLAGLAPQQLEAIIAHELAHIRRQDYLVNLLQVVVETLLFYHPAVWWVSRRIRQEREHCCDDLAVAVCGDAIAYARALLELEQLRASEPQLAVAANGGSLMTRIERLLGRKTSHCNRYPGLLAGVVVMAALLSAAVGAQILLPSAAAGRQVVAEAQPEAVRPVSGAASRVVTGGGNEVVFRAEPASTPRPVDGDETTRIAVEIVQDEVEDPPADVAEALKALSSTDPAVRAAAACRLGKLGATESIPPLVNLLGDDTPIPSMKCWEGGNWTPARERFKQASPGEQAAIALAAQGQAAVAPLVAALDSPDAIIRRNAAWALGEVRGGGSTDRSSAVEPLITVLHDADPWVRTAAAFALGELRARRSVEALIGALGDAEGGVRTMAAWALGEMKTRSGVEGLTVLLLRDEAENVRQMAAWALGEIRDPAAVEALTVALNDQTGRVRATARWAISEIRD